jgi:hypothetical protein
MKTETGLLAALVVGLGIFLLVQEETPKKPAPKPAPKRGKLPPRPRPAPIPAPIVLGPRPFVPFEFLVRDESNALMAKREYDGYLDGSLPLETYPFEWFAREDQVILKVGPGKWVELDEHPITLESLLGISAPSWLTVSMFAAGVALTVAPEVLAYYGVEGALVEGVLPALEATRIAHKIAQVVLAARESTAAGVAEVAAQLYSIPAAGPTLGDIVQNLLQTAGLRVVIKAAAGAALDE